MVYDEISRSTGQQGNAGNTTALDPGPGNIELTANAASRPGSIKVKANAAYQVGKNIH